MNVSTVASPLTARARAVLPGGVSSNVRLPNSSVFFERGHGSRLWDVDGNEYIDYLLGQGPAFLGHANGAVNSAVATAVHKGMVFGAQHRQEVEAAEKLLGAIGWADKVRLGVSGTEAVQGALRIARAATGRRRIIRFEGQYHGWIDNVLMAFPPGEWTVGSAGQPADALADWLVVPFNDPAALTEAFRQHGPEIAAVIMEPMMCNSGAIVPVPGFLETVRELTRAAGTVLIFDEVITGFRLALGGATERFGVVPDLAVFGKAVAGGWPVSAIAGTDELWGPVADGIVNHSGTFNASVMASAAVASTIDVLTDDPPYARIDEIGSYLMEQLSSLASEHVSDLHVQGLPVAFHVSFGSGGTASSHAELQSLDLKKYEAFARILVEHRVWVAGRGIWYLSAAHDRNDADETLTRFSEALEQFAGSRPIE